MPRTVRSRRPSVGDPDTRQCMGTLVLDDLIDDPRVGGGREAPGDAGGDREDARKPPPGAADSRDSQQAERRDDRRRAR